MKKKINDNLILYFNNIYPYKATFRSKKKHCITIGIGGNIGDVKKRFKQLFKMLNNDSRFTIIESSPLLKNPPFGYTKQNNFINAVILLKTDLSPYQSLKVFQRYEIRFKRERSFQDAPRTLDIDIIFYDNLSINTPNLTIPHNGYKDRESVLIPLKYLNKF